MHVIRVSRSLVTIVWRPPCAGVSTPLSLSVPHGQHRPPTPCGDSPVAESAVLREGGWRGLVRHHHAVWGCDMLGFCCVLQLLCMCSMLRAAYSARFLCLSVWTVVWRLPRIADPIRHPIPWCGPRYGFRSWAVAVCVAIKYVVLCITLDRTCTDTLNQPRARLARLGRLHGSVYTRSQETHAHLAPDSYVQMCACSLCAPKSLGFGSLWQGGTTRPCR